MARQTRAEIEAGHRELERRKRERKDIMRGESQSINYMRGDKYNVVIRTGIGKPISYSEDLDLQDMEELLVSHARWAAWYLQRNNGEGAVMIGITPAKE